MLLFNNLSYRIRLKNNVSMHTIYRSNNFIFMKNYYTMYLKLVYKITEFVHP